MLVRMANTRAVCENFLVSILAHVYRTTNSKTCYMVTRNHCYILSTLQKHQQIKDALFNCFSLLICNDNLKAFLTFYDILARSRAAVGRDGNVKGAVPRNLANYSH